MQPNSGIEGLTMVSKSPTFSVEIVTINGLTARYLDLNRTASDHCETYAKNSAIATSFSIGCRVWKRTVGGTETELSAGTPIAVVTKTADFGDYETATWACPGSSVVSTDAIVVRVYMRADAGAWELASAWITEQLFGDTIIDTSTWTFKYRLIVTMGDGIYFEFGPYPAGVCISQIAGISLIPSIAGGISVQVI